MNTMPPAEIALPQGYDPSAFERPSVTADIAFFTVREKALQVLTHGFRRLLPPY